MPATADAGRTTTTSEDLDALNSLLRGHISSVETYDQAINKYRGSDSMPSAVAGELTRLRDDHAKAVSTLRSRVKSYGGTPADGAGAWGVFANTVEGMAKLLGPETALAALKQGEQHGLNEYERISQLESVSSETKYLITSELMPQGQEHVSALDRLTGQIEQKKG
jgi:hypothetical protein